MGMLPRRWIPALATLATLVLAGHVPAARGSTQPPVTQPPIDEREILYDADGLIIHEDGGGDTAQREGWYWLGVWIRQNTQGLQSWTKPRKLNVDQVLKLLEPKGDGVFYRHPKLSPWNNPYDKKVGFSRDQMLPLVAAMGVWGKKAELRRLWDALPEDAFGKHAFNGNWRNFLGQDGANCSEIKKRGCDPTADCSLKKDNRDCSLKTDNTDCNLKTDNTDCSLKTDTRDCSVCILYRPGWPFGDGGCAQRGNDPVCELAKGAQNVAYAAVKAACEGTKAVKNAGYKAEHDGCEATKFAKNAAYKAEHDGCEATKFAKNAGYKAEHDGCEAGKAAQDALYKGEHDACEAAKTTSKMVCEGQKAADQLACFATNVHSGDLIGPAAVNVFRRAMGENPLVPLSESLPLPPVNVGIGALGESELIANVGIRIAIASRDRDDTGDDLNLIVSLLMAKLRFSTPTSAAATAAYVGRPHSFGSFLGAYRKQYGADSSEQKDRIANGIRRGWKPEVSAPFGAARWYHRPDSGGNPLLALLYEPIISRFIVASAP